MGAERIAAALGREIETLTPHAKRVADRFGIQDVRISFSRRDHETFLVVKDAAGADRAFLTWVPERPGDEMRRRLMPILLSGSMVGLTLLVLLVVYVRRLARDLALSQEQAQSFVGRDPLSRLPNRLVFVKTRRFGRRESGSRPTRTLGLLLAEGEFPGQGGGRRRQGAPGGSARPSTRTGGSA